MQPTFSVIIPVYNAEKTIHRCIDSLLEQNCSDVEIILVNDGSRDSSGTICEGYARNHENIQYICQQNAGVSAARNAGLDAARGDYILFVDSDDYVAEELFSTLRNALAAHSVDLLHFSHANVRGEETTPRRVAAGDYTDAEMERALQQAICDKSLNAPWGKVYRRDLIEENHIRFPLGISIGEDRLFNMEYALQVQSYAALDTIGYFLSLENEQSLSRRINDLDEQNRLIALAYDAMMTRSKASPDRKELICRAENFGICRGVYAKAKNMHRERMGLSDRLRRIHALCREFNSQKLKMPDTRYCRWASLPVRRNLAVVIDAMAAVLVRRK